MVYLQNCFWEEMMELHDEIDPKKNINKIFNHTMCESHDCHFPMGALVGVHPMH